MATTTTVVNSFKDEIGQAIHSLLVDTVKVSLFPAAAAFDKNLRGLWRASVAYAVNEIVISSAGRVYKATVGGNSSSTEPTHTSGTATDGGVTWSYLGAEITGTNYPAGGVAAPNPTLTSSRTNSDIAAYDWDNAVFANVTVANVIYAVMLNTSKAGRAIQFCAYDAPGKAATAADFTVTIPESGTGALRFA